jgi:Xaa-Pro aminopeptidase
MRAVYCAFDRAEFQTRFARARTAIKGAGARACLMMAPEHLYYFAGYDTWVSVNSPQALIFTDGDDAPTLLVRDVDLALALETTWIADILTYNLISEDFAERVRDILLKKGFSGGRVAAELSSYALPTALGDMLRAAMGSAELFDATRVLGDLRHRKSPAELAYMEEAARYANLGLAAMSECATPGVTPRSRLIDKGDLVHAEFAGVAARYHATAIQTIACGAPSPRARELYEIAMASLRAGMDAVRPGVPVAEVEEASLAPLRAHGLEEAAMMRFGYGVGVAYPPIWLETLQIARGFDFTLEPGMAFVLHSCLELPEESLGVIQGGTWVLENEGLRLLAGAGLCPLKVL